MKKYRKINKMSSFVIVLLILLSSYVTLKSPSESSLRSRVIKLTSAGGLCSGEQVRAPSGVDYILTAGHCRPLADADGNILATSEGGKSLPRKIIAEDPDSDLLLLEGIPGLRGLDIAMYMAGQEHVRTYTHGHRFPTYRTDGHLVGYQVVATQVDDKECDGGMSKYSRKSYNSIFGEVSICVMEVTEMATDALVVPGSSGGPIINDSGKLVGVVSLGGAGFGYLVPAYAIDHFIKNY